MATDNYTRTFTSFSGADIVATFGSKVIGELQGITYSVTREKAPIYTLGSPDPRSFSRGKRGIAGNLVFTVFDRDALLSEIGEGQKIYGIGRGLDYSKEGSPTAIHEWNPTVPTDNDRDARATNVSYVDELPPFDITITFANEYGQMAVMKIFGVEILNEGSGMSIDDVVTERAMTYIARRIEHIRRID